jgi:2-haloacid dehalogenase
MVDLERRGRVGIPRPRLARHVSTPDLWLRAYVPYEKLVRDAARVTGLPEAASDNLEKYWLKLAAWDGAQNVLDALRGRAKLAVVTNCSIRLGLLAAGRLNAHWDCVMTAEEAGYYKPDPRPYELALARLEVSARDAIFVPAPRSIWSGTSAVGLRTYWHNRVGLSRPDGVPPPEVEQRTLNQLIPWMEGLRS